jgi:glycosyltransferase involved in cell wall biosynthesis
MSKKKNVLMIVENSYPADPRVRKEAQSLQGDLQLHVLALRRKGERWRETVDGVRVTRIPRFPEFGAVGRYHYALEYAYLTIASLLAFLFSHPFRRYRAVHVHNPPDTLFVVGAVAKLLGARFVFDHHDLSPELYLTRFGKRKDLPYRTLLRMERLSCRTADAVITTNRSYRDLECERHGIPPEKVTIVRNDPLLEDADGPAGEPDPSAPPLIFLGSINPQDGVDLLVRVVHRLAVVKGRRDVRCTVLGIGDSLEAVRELAR